MRITIAKAGAKRAPKSRTARIVSTGQSASYPNPVYVPDVVNLSIEIDMPDVPYESGMLYQRERILIEFTHDDSVDDIDAVIARLTDLRSAIRVTRLKERSECEHLRQTNYQDDRTDNCLDCGKELLRDDS